MMLISDDQMIRPYPEVHNFVTSCLNHLNSHTSNIRIRNMNCKPKFNVDMFTF